MIHNMKFKCNVFEGYNVLLCVKHDLIIICWVINLNTDVEHLAFNVNPEHI
jgi:hypothetical protein